MERWKDAHSGTWTAHDGKPLPIDPILLPFMSGGRPLKSAMIHTPAFQDSTQKKHPILILRIIESHLI